MFINFVVACLTYTISLTVTLCCQLSNGLPLDEIYESGSVLEFRCRSRYIPDGDMTMTCSDGQWTTPSTCQSN